MTREELKQYLIWSGFTNSEMPNTLSYNTDNIEISIFNEYFYIYLNTRKIAELSFKYSNCLAVLEYIINIKLIIEAPKPSIKEQLKDCKAGDFVTFRDIKLGVKKAVFVKLSDYWIHFFYKNENGRDTMACGHPVDSIQEIIKIQHNKYNILNNYEEFCNEK